MSNSIIFLTTLMIISVFATFLATIIKQVKIKEIEAKNPQQPKKEKPKTGKLTPEEFLRTMDFLMQNQIITGNQYNQLIAKAYPFLE